MADLTPEEKLFVVESLARFHTPTEVAELLLQEFNKTASLPQIARYNPQRKTGETLSADLVEAFRAARQTFLADRSEIAIAAQTFRLRELLDLYRVAKTKKNAVLAAQLLEQAAKEVGGVYVGHGSDPDLDKRIAEVVAFLVGKGQKETPR